MRGPRNLSDIDILESAVWFNQIQEAVLEEVSKDHYLFMLAVSAPRIEDFGQAWEEDEYQFDYDPRNLPSAVDLHLRALRSQFVQTYEGTIFVTVEQAAAVPKEEALQWVALARNVSEENPKLIVWLQLWSLTESHKQAWLSYEAYFRSNLE